MPEYPGGRQARPDGPCAASARDTRRRVSLGIMYRGALFAIALVVTMPALADITGYDSVPAPG